MIPINDKEKAQETINEEKVEVIDSVPEEETEAAGESAAAENAETAEDADFEPVEGENGRKDRKSRREERKAAKEAEKIGEKLKEKLEENAVLNDKYLRICAEYDNFRRRSQKEKDNLYGDIRSDVITKFLPVYDNLERALAAKTEDEAYAKGVEMIMNQFKATLEKLGVEEIPALGEKFNPELHNAVMHTDDESKGENEIVEVFQKGFRIGDKIVRFAMVKVAN